MSDRSDARADATALQLRTGLAARLRPLVALLTLVIALAAPIAFYAVGVRTLRVQAGASAKQVAEVIGRDAARRPVLWRYDSLKLLDHLRTYAMQDGIEHVDVVDPAGVPIERTHLRDVDRLVHASVIWESAPVIANNDGVGHVWVAVSTLGVRTDALLMLVPFLALGGALGGLMYWLPLRVVGTAEGRIGGLIARLEESQMALSELNENLERQVEARSSELATAYKQLEDRSRRLGELTSRAVQMQEAERRAIARELHDSAGQAMTAIRIHLQVIEQRVPGHGILSLVQRTTSMVDDALEEIRRAVYRLGPAVLDDVGLRDAVTRLCEDFAERNGIPVDSSIALDAVDLPAAVEATCYRLVQETLTNVARHAAARRVQVRLEAGPDSVVLELRDDGRGFDANVDGRDQSRGLVGMRERVELLGGTLVVESSPGMGTRIEAVVPVAHR